MKAFTHCSVINWTHNDNSSVPTWKTELILLNPDFIVSIVSHLLDGKYEGPNGLPLRLVTVSTGEKYMVVGNRY